MDGTKRGSSNKQRYSSEESLEERLKFDTLLAELSVHFVDLAAERVDEEVEGAQRRICALLDIDRSTLWRFDPDEPGNAVMSCVLLVGAS